MVKLKDVNGKVDTVDPKNTLGLCDKCNKRITYKYVQVDGILVLWVVRCSCGYLNICEVKNNG